MATFLIFPAQVFSIYSQGLHLIDKVQLTGVLKVDENFQTQLMHNNCIWLPIWLRASSLI